MCLSLPLEMCFLLFFFGAEDLPKKQPTLFTKYENITKGFLSKPKVSTKYCTLGFLFQDFALHAASCSAVAKSAV